MGSLTLKFALMLAAIAFFTTVFFFGIHVMPYQNNNGANPILILGSIRNIGFFFIGLGVLGYLSVMLLPDRGTGDRPKRKYKLFWLAALVFSIPFAVTKALFGINEIEPILIFFRDNQMDDMVSVGMDGFTGPLKFWLILILVIIASSLFLLSYKKHFGKVLAVTGLALLSLSPLLQYIGNLIVPNAAQRNFVIADRMRPPVILEKPASQKNLVLIYLESTERSYGMVSAFKPFYQPLQSLADSGVELTNMMQTTGANFTIGGIVASQCGIPLLSKGLQSVFFKNDVEASLDDFLPSVRCLGDQLSDDGYTLSYMNGASLDKFSKRSFLREHGFTRLFDIASLTEAQKQGRTNVWGLNDALLFENAVKEFDTLVAAKKPFVQSMLTLSTHGPDAFLDNDCAPTPNTDSQIPRAFECTGQLISEFVDYIRASEVGDDTIIVVMNDHLSFFNTVQAQLDSIGAKRRNLFMVLGTGTQDKINRKMTTFDLYPTLLEALGYNVQDGRGNLGVSLNSPVQNLAEELGIETLNRTFKGNQKLASYLWRSE
jgi:phosphoglycerol transferase